MTTITASYTVVPNESTPKGRMWLSDSDQLEPWTHVTTVYIYNANHSQQNDAVERMRDSLSKILVYYYPVAGRLRCMEGGRFELDCNAKGVMLLEAESSKTMDEYGGFSPKDPIKELVPKVDYNQPIEDIPLILMQLTRFQGDKGLAIGTAISHVLADAIGVIRFINSWAKLVRGDTLLPDEMSPFLDRTILMKPPHPPSTPRPCFDHPELKPFPFILGRSDDNAERKEETTGAVLKLTSEQVQKLKEKTNDNDHFGSPRRQRRPYSRYEAIAAHIWRSASKARQLADQQPTIVRVVANIRSRLNPPLPRNYFGNALATTVTPLCQVGDIISNPLSYAAHKIREAVDMLTDEYIMSYLDFIRGQEQMDAIRDVNCNIQGQHRDSKFFGNPNLSIGSWTSLPIYEADFGWGKPVHFGPANEFPDGRGYILPTSEGDGSVEIVIHLQVAHMQLFQECFYEDI